jgi:hypothetical protein
MQSTTRAQIALALALLALQACSKSQPGNPRQDLEARFKAAMDGTALEGNMKGLGKDKISQGEKFVIERVTRIAGETWLFPMRFQYGKNDVPVPVPLRVAWAGDTPVLTLTDVPVPGYGTYSARVVIYKEQFAGMWVSPKGGGGQIFGKVVRNDPR